MRDLENCGEGVNSGVDREGMTSNGVEGGVRSGRGSFTSGELGVLCWGYQE